MPTKKRVWFIGMMVSVILVSPDLGAIDEDLRHVPNPLLNRYPALEGKMHAGLVAAVDRRRLEPVGGLIRVEPVPVVGLV